MVNMLRHHHAGAYVLWARIFAKLFSKCNIPAGHMLLMGLYTVHNRSNCDLSTITHILFVHITLLSCLSSFN